MAYQDGTVTGAVVKLNCPEDRPEDRPVLNAQAARALLRLLKGARARRQDREEHRKAS